MVPFFTLFLLAVIKSQWMFVALMHIIMDCLTCTDSLCKIHKCNDVNMLPLKNIALGFIQLLKIKLFTVENMNAFHNFPLRFYDKDLM